MQLGELVASVYIREFISPCLVSTLLVLNKDNAYKMCVDNKAINSITIKYMCPLPKLGVMLDE